MIKTVFIWLAYLLLGAFSLSLAGGLLTLALSVGTVVLVIGGIIFVGAFLVFCVKEYITPTESPPKNKQ